MTSSQASLNPEQRLAELGLVLPPAPQPFGAYVPAVQTGRLLFLSGMLATENGQATFVGRVGVELDIETGRRAARLAALNALALARQHLGTLDRIRRTVRIGVSIASSGELREHPKVADGASELLQEVLGKERAPCRLVVGVASLPLGSPVELELIFEVDE
jgi:enamine deaminase RidA (YjgF/YER057c/UK114 family)